MDANKLLEILLLLEADEKDFSFGTKIEEMRNFITQNNEEGNKQIEQRLSEIEANIKLSRAILFSGTEAELLRVLSANDYFGLPLIESLQSALNSRGGYAISARLNKFQEGRKEKYSNLMKLKESMTAAGVSSYKQTQDEIALSLPETKTGIVEASEYLQDFGRFVEAVQDCIPVKAGQKIAPPRIIRLSKGGVDFFSSVDPQVVESVLHTLGDLAALYLTVKDIRGKKEEPYRDDAEKTEVAKIYEKAVERKVEEFLAQAVEKIAKASSNEKKTTLRTYLKILLKWIPLGINVEVVFSKSVTPIKKDEKGENDKATVEAREEKYLKQTEILKMYKLPPEQLMLPDTDKEEKEKPKKK